MDPLSQFVGLLRPTAAVSKPISGRGRWGVRYRAHGAPGFTLVLKGGAWITLADASPLGLGPLRLEQGDFLLLPATPAFSLSSEPGVACTPFEPRDEAVRHGDPEGEPDFASLGGSFTFEQVNAPLLRSLLPEVILIPAAAGKATRFGRLVELLADECRTEAPGKDLVIQRMLEVLLVEALRWRDASNDTLAPGLGNGLRDPALARALRALHSDVRNDWTVAGLAGIAGMSRSAFAARFGQALGCGPIEYLVRWRMALAKDALIAGSRSLDRIAEDIGYESASAFSTAFRKRFGCPPGRFGRQGVALAT